VRTNGPDFGVLIAVTALRGDRLVVVLKNLDGPTQISRTLVLAESPDNARTENSVTPAPEPRNTLFDVLRRECGITIAVLNWNTLRYASEGNRFAGGISFWAGFLAGFLAYYLEKRIKLFWERKNHRPGPRVAERDAGIRIAGRTYNIPRWLTRGYLNSTGQGLNLSRVHVRAIVAAACILALYLAACFFRLATPCYLALAVAMLIWLLGALAFFFDAYRIPVIFPLILWMWIISGHPKTDHSAIASIYFESSA